MTNYVTTEELFSKLSEEKKTGELLPLPETLYEVAETPPPEDQTPDGNLKQQENKKRILAALRARRIQKILTYIAFGRNLPHPIPKEEERLYIRIKRIVEEGNEGHKTTKIKVLVNTPELTTPEGKRIGPFEKNMLIEVENQQDLEFLIKNKIGETANQ